MISERHSRLLAFVDAVGSGVQNIDFQKLLLLYCHESDSSPAYEFVPYHFGGFSFTSYADKRNLAAKGLLTSDERTWALTKAGETQARRSRTSGQALAFARHYDKLRGEALVADTYRRYPYYAINSEMAHRLLASRTDALRAIEAIRPAPRGRGVATIGYQGRTLEGYLNRIIQAGLTLLCDVRRNPLSRKYGFSKTTLANACKGVGLRYEHLGELGIASSERRELKTQADYDRLFAQYETDTIPAQPTSLAKIAGWVEDGAAVALTCFEERPEQCHRLCVARHVGAACGIRDLVHL